MPTNNKYELRSNEVQEVMKKPPHALITWGNTLIALILIVGFYLLNKITIPQKITIPFQLIQVQNPSTGIQTFAFQLDSNFSDKIKTDQPINISFESYPSNTYGTIQSEIDTITVFQNKINIFIKSFNKQNKILFKGTLRVSLLGNATIQVGKTNLISTIKNRAI